MDDLVDIGAAILLRRLKDTKNAGKFRAVFLKLLRAIAAAYANDPEFVDVMKAWSIGPTQK